MSSARERVVFPLFHGSLFLITLYISYISNPGSNLFSWHPFLMTVGMFLLMNEAVVMFSPVWSPIPKAYHKKMYLNGHAYVQAVVFTGFVVGFFVIYQNKENNSKPHFTSWHGLLGLFQASLLGLQVTLGILAKYALMLPAAVRRFVPSIKTFHDLLGVGVVGLAAANMVTGFFTNFFTSQTIFALPYLLSATMATLYGFVGFRTLTTNSRITKLFSRKLTSN